MFTGIITEVGSVRALARSGPSASLAVVCRYPALVLGESIAVDGACLTVARIEPWGFVADASAETLERTTLGAYVAGRRVNLERALAVGDRLGGHLVAGHVDGVGVVRAREPVREAERWRFDAPPNVLRFVAEKGSITIDGVSLTVNAVQPAGFEVMLVPHTLASTALRDRTLGAAVNLEVDLLARYVARALEARAAGPSRDEPATQGTSGVSLELLARAGYLDR